MELSNNIVDLHIFIGMEFGFEYNILQLNACSWCCEYHKYSNMKYATCEWIFKCFLSNEPAYIYVYVVLGQS